MAVKSVTDIKANLRASISVYVSRREKAKSDFLKISKNINSKLSTWRRQLNRIGEWEDKLRNIDTLIKDFTGFSSKGTIYSRNKNKILAKQLMCRYAMESGISGKFIRDYIGGNGQWTVGKSRMRFIRKCQQDNELKNTWNNFLKFVKENAK